MASLQKIYGTPYNLAIMVQVPKLKNLGDMGLLYMALNYIENSCTNQPLKKNTNLKGNYVNSVYTDKYTFIIDCMIWK